MVCWRSGQLFVCATPRLRRCVRPAHCANLDAAWLGALPCTTGCRRDGRRYWRGAECAVPEWMEYRRRVDGTGANHVHCGRYVLLTVPNREFLPRAYALRFGALSRAARIPSWHRCGWRRWLCVAEHDPTKGRFTRNVSRFFGRIRPVRTAERIYRVPLWD